jgi:hypothetical protein
VIAGGTVEIVVDPEVQAQFDANLAEYRAKADRVSENLKAEQREITERTKAADEKFEAERTELLSKLKDEFKEPKDGEQPQRPVGWHPVEGDGGGRKENVIRFNDDEAEEAPQAPRPAARPRPVVQDDDDYSEQSWLRG